jgi:hypothetical protein
MTYDRDKMGNCVMCVKPATSKWTLNGRGEIAVAPLCNTHGDILMLFMRQAQDKAPIKPAAPRVVQRPGRNLARPRLEPLNWTPPEKRKLMDA